MPPRKHNDRGKSFFIGPRSIDLLPQQQVCGRVYIVEHPRRRVRAIETKTLRIELKPARRRVRTIGSKDVCQLGVGRANSSFGKTQTNTTNTYIKRWAGGRPYRQGRDGLLGQRGGAESLNLRGPLPHPRLIIQNLAKKFEKL